LPNEMFCEHGALVGVGAVEPFPFFKAETGLLGVRITTDFVVFLATCVEPLLNAVPDKQVLSTLR
jgi:hypothetical protein